MRPSTLQGLRAVSLYDGNPKLNRSRSGRGIAALPLHFGWRVRIHTSTAGFISRHAPCAWRYIGTIKPKNFVSAPPLWVGLGCGGTDLRHEVERARVRRRRHTPTKSFEVSRFRVWGFCEGRRREQPLRSDPVASPTTPRLWIVACP